MRRWPRLLTLVTIAAAAVLALAWLRSYWVSDGVFWKDKRVMLRVMSSRGRVLVGYWRSVGTQDFPQVGIGYARRLPRDLAEMTVRPDTSSAPDWRWSRLGFVLERDQGPIVRGGTAIIPYWVVLVVGATLVSASDCFGPRSSDAAAVGAGGAKRAVTICADRRNAVRSVAVRSVV